MTRPAGSIVTRRDATRVGGAFGLVTVVLMLTVWLSSEHLPRQEQAASPRFTTMQHGDEVLGPWLYWDARHFGAIVRDGYNDADVVRYQRGGAADVAFFPGYPLVVGAVDRLVGEIGLALVLVTLAAGAVLVQVLYRWLRLQTSAAAAGCAVAVTLLYPWSYVLIAAGYSDALFLALTVASFLLVEHDRPVLAGLVGALATATRLAGVGLLIGLALRVAERRGALRFDGWRPHLDRSKLHRPDAGVLLAASGIVAWMAFCWVRYASPVAFSTAQRGWGQGFGPRSWFKLGLVDQVVNNADTFFVLRLVAHGVAIVVLAAAVPSVFRRFGVAYGTYTAIVVGLPLLGSANFASNGRLGLAAFPCFALAGEHLAANQTRLARPALVASGVVLVGVASCWGRGYWMA